MGASPIPPTSACIPHISNWSTTEVFRGRIPAFSDGRTDMGGGRAGGQRGTGGGTDTWMDMQTAGEGWREGRR